MPAKFQKVERAQALAFRLRRQSLARRAPARSLLKIAGAAGIHAQVSSSAELQFWARLDGVTADHVRRELWERRSLLKIWSLRGTLHLVPAADLDVFTLSLIPIDEERLRKRLERWGIPKELLDRVTEAVGEALDGRALSRKELAVEVMERMRESMPNSEALKPWLESSWGSVYKPASNRGFLCFAQPRGSQSIFVRPDQWTRITGKRYSPEEARRELARRYLSAYAPTTRLEFTTWAGMEPADAKTVWESMGDEIATVDYEGRKFFALARDLKEMRSDEIEEEVRLLPGFDTYVLGRDRQGIIEGNKPRKLIYRDAAWISPVLLQRGRFAGVWSHKKSARGLSVEVRPFTRLAKGVRAEVQSEAESLAVFLGSPQVEVRYAA